MSLGDKQDFLDKLDSEGGLGGMLSYQGPNLESYYNLPAEFIDKWRRLSDLFEEVLTDLDNMEEQCQ